MCKYNNHNYWEGALLRKKDLWKNYFTDLDCAQDAIFINTVVIDYTRDTVDNNWACYPDAKSLLGFIQYVYLPVAFFYTINKGNQDLLIPICSSHTFIESITESGSDYIDNMKNAIEELNSYWDLDDSLCIKKIKDFCATFNAFWNKDNYILHIGVFESTFEIAEHLIDTREFIEVLEEDIGLTIKQLFNMCTIFYTDKFIQKTFVKILNNRIGCIV